MADDKPHRIESTLEIDVPVRAAYNQWTQFESFPEFMEGIEEVTQIDDKHIHWVAKVAGKEKEWDAEIVDQQPDKYIAWRSTSGDITHGSVSFEGLGPAKCRVTLLLTYQPETTVEKVGSSLGLVNARVEGDLKRFKQFIEQRGQETGSWRGTVEKGHIESGSVSGANRPPRPHGPVHAPAKPTLIGENDETR